MKLSDLIRNYPFDSIVPELIALDPETETQLAWYKQAYDILLETKPSDDSWEIEVARNTDQKEDGTLQGYVHARHCEGQPWDGCLGCEVVIQDGIPEASALARILWGMTFYGYSEEDRSGKCDNRPRNIFQSKAERLRDNQFRNYSYGLAGEFGRRYRSLSPEGWKVFHWRKAHCNRAKRMRDARQERSIARLERAGKVQMALDRFLPKDREALEYLFETQRILELDFGSHIHEAGERASYVTELITKYFHGDISMYTRCEILITTAPEFRLSADELRTIYMALVPLLGIPSDADDHPHLRYFSRTDRSMDRNLHLHLVLSR